jgi:anti-anti-sigma factor
MGLVTVAQAGGRVPVTVFHLQDRVNLGNVGELEQAAREAYGRGVRDLLIDLTDVPSITSAGLRGIVSIYKLLLGDAPGASPGGPQKSAHLRLLNPTPYVRDVLNMAGLTDYIEIYENLEEAVASF